MLNQWRNLIIIDKKLHVLEIFLQEHFLNYLKRSNKSRISKQKYLLFLWNRTMMMSFENKCKVKRWINLNGVGKQKNRNLVWSQIHLTGVLVTQLLINKLNLKNNQNNQTYLTLILSKSKSKNKLMYLTLIPKHLRFNKSKVYSNLMHLVFHLQNQKYLAQRMC